MKTIAAIAVLLLAGAGAGIAAESLGRTAAVTDSCASETCQPPPQGSSSQILCLAEDRCGTAAPRPLAEIERFDARMKALAR